MDSGLLVLFVVGTLDVSLVPRHGRTDDFTAEDYELLTRCLGTYKRIHVTPNIVTEASNLLRQTDRKCGEKLMDVLREVIGRIDESYVTSKKAASSKALGWAGVADCSIVKGFGKRIDILTVDFPLYRFLQASGYRAINFHNLRPANWGLRI